MIWFLIAFQILLMTCRIGWQIAARNYEFTVPGSLEHEAAAHTRRVWRWPGALAYPFWVVTSAWIDADLMLTGWAVVIVPMFLLFLVGAYFDLQQLRKELKEDKDDWWNKTKRGTRRAVRTAVRAFRPRVPVGVQPRNLPPRHAGYRGIPHRKDARPIPSPVGLPPIGPGGGSLRVPVGVQS